jgi:hypothetical protein
MWLSLIFILLFTTAYAQDTLIGAWQTITPPSGMVDGSTMLICYEFNYAADSSEIVDVSNYQLKRVGGSLLTIYALYWITAIDGIDVEYTRLVGLKVPKLKYRDLYSFGYKAQADTFFYNGFAPNLVPKPNVQIR